MGGLFHDSAVEAWKLGKMADLDGKGRRSHNF
jgi:hypothetical protein